MDLHLESFSGAHAHLQCDQLIEQARAALGKYHESPVALHVDVDGSDGQIRLVFEAADERTRRTYQRQRIIEDAAIAIAGIVLREHYDLCIVKATYRGSHADYFVGPRPGQDPIGVVEVSGTDERPLDAVFEDKLRQVGRSTWAERFVSVTRFATPATKCGRSGNGARYDE